MQIGKEEAKNKQWCCPNCGVAIPNNSTEVLQEWLDKQLGGPVVYGYRYTESGPIYWNPASIVINGESPIETIAAYRKPEIK